MHASSPARGDHVVWSVQTFVTLGPASLLVFAELLCIASVGVYAALWFIGRHTDKHCG